jgi:hypothetical protein
VLETRLPEHQQAERRAFVFQDFLAKYYFNILLQQSLFTGGELKGKYKS